MAKLSRYLTRIRENKVRPYIKGKVLDLGCGEAKAINYKAVTRYFGVDLDHKCKELTKKYPSGEFLSKNLENDKINLLEKVDLVLMSAFIEHIKNYDNPIRQSINNLKSGGSIVITTPTKFGNFIHFCGEIFGLFPKSVRNSHKIILSKSDFIEIGQKYNLKLKKYKKFELFCNHLVIFEKWKKLALTLSILRMDGYWYWTYVNS